MKKLAKKIIKKYKKELCLEGWDIDIALAPVKTHLYTNIKKKEALIAINKKECKTQMKLNTIIKYQLIRLKIKIKIYS